MVGVLVGTDEEIGARGGELAHIFLEQPPDCGVVAALISLHHEVHRDAGQRHFRMKMRTHPTDPFEARLAIAKRRPFEAVRKDSYVLHR